ncbi:MAG: DUF4256 domain-containing protein [Chitinophagaceae bacterium]
MFQHFNPNYLATIVFAPKEKETLVEWTVLFETTELFETVAIFCDRRYDTVFLYHNGAESYYAARAFRGSLIV